MRNFVEKNDDDKAKPYGKWFQDDVLSLEYKKPLRKRFGLGPEPRWSVRVPNSMEADGLQEEDEVAAHIPEEVGRWQDDPTTDKNSVNEFGWGLQHNDDTHNRQVRPFIPDLNDLASFFGCN